MTLKLWHRGFASLLGLFIVAHLGNHLTIWFGADQHIAVMDALRNIYRHPVVETTLLIAVLVQVVLGVALIRKRGRPDTGWAWMQVLSGGYLLVFLAQHVPAVLYGRWVLGLDTNIYFAAATVDRMPLNLYFAPYYAMGVAALFAHLAAALRFARWNKPAGLLWVLPVFGLILGVALVVGLMDITVPQAYQRS